MNIMDSVNILSYHIIHLYMIIIVCVRVGHKVDWEEYIDETGNPYVVHSDTRSVHVTVTWCSCDDHGAIL